MLTAHAWFPQREAVITTIFQGDVNLKITMAHGSGGESTSKLISKYLPSILIMNICPNSRTQL